MGKLIYSLAMSLDNKIAKPDGDVGWLQNIPNPAKSDYEFEKFYDSVGTVLMGYNTYDVIRSFDNPWPYSGKHSYVVTHKSDPTEDSNVKFINNNIEKFLNKLKSQVDKNIWLVGGGNLATHLFNQEHIDHFLLHIMPILLGDGIPFMLPALNESLLKLSSHKVYGSGVVELKYEVNKRI